MKTYKNNVFNTVTRFYCTQTTEELKKMIDLLQFLEWNGFRQKQLCGYLKISFDKISKTNCDMFVEIAKITAD